MLETKIGQITVKIDKIEDAISLTVPQDRNEFEKKCSLCVLNLEEINANVFKRKKQLCKLLFEKYGREISYLSYSNNLFLQKIINAVIREAAISICIKELIEEKENKNILNSKKELKITKNF